MERTVWAAMKADHALRTRHQPDAELARTFFNSVTRRVFSTVGADPAIEYVEDSPPGGAVTTEPAIYDSHAVETVDRALVQRILQGFRWSVPYAQLQRDSALVAEIISERLVRVLGSTRALQIDVLRSLFYRNKGAYLVGRIRAGE